MRERPHVVWDALLVRPDPTGVGRSILELARAMSARDQGVECTVLVTHPRMFAFLEGAPHWRVRECRAARGGTLPKALYTQLALPRLVRRLEADLLHSHQFVAPVRLPCPSVITLHDLAFLDHPETVEQPRRAYYRLLVARSLHRAACVVTNSAATAADAVAHFPRLEDRVAVTRFGTPSWVWRQAPAGAPRAPDAPFLFVGTLEPRKNLGRLLQAYRLFLDRRRAGRSGIAAPHLVLVGGKGWRDSTLKEPIQQLQERGVLECEGYCDQARLWSLYSTARALLFPSLQEGFGFPILEAMAAGLPVLTSDRGAMREVAERSALLVNPESVEEIVAGMEELNDDAALWSQLSDHGRQRAKALSWERTADATAGVYHRLLAAGTSRSAK